MDLLGIGQLRPESLMYCANPIRLEIDGGTLRSIFSSLLVCPVGGTVDTEDLKSSSSECGFESHTGYKNLT